MTNKTKLFEWYTNQENRFNIGQGKVIQFKHMFQLYLLADIYIFVKLKIYLSLKWMVIASIGLMFIFWLIGWIWDKLDLIHYQAEFSNKRDPAIKQIRKKLGLKEEIVTK